MLCDKFLLIVNSSCVQIRIQSAIEQEPDYLAAAYQGKLLFGTIDCFLLWRLSRGQIHATDITNAARTLLFDINETRWDQELLDLFNMPSSMLPRVVENNKTLGFTAPGFFKESLPILAMIGDQQAA